jgi:hypothetical protein
MNSGLYGYPDKLPGGMALLPTSVNMVWNPVAHQVGYFQLLGGASTLRLATGRIQRGSYILELQQVVGGGGSTVTWGSGVGQFQWHAGVAPVLSTASLARDKISFLWDGQYMVGGLFVRGQA